jgi:hypothetical protein
LRPAAVVQKGHAQELAVLQLLDTQAGTAGAVVTRGSFLSVSGWFSGSLADPLRGVRRRGPKRAALARFFWAKDREVLPVTDPDQTPNPDAADPRPWERPGAVRKDVAPHRGKLLRALANASRACGIAALVLGAPALLGVPLALATRIMVEHDLERMGTGRLDPRGRAETWAAGERANHALALGFMAPFISLMLWCGCLNALRCNTLHN